MCKIGQQSDFWDIFHDLQYKNPQNNSLPLCLVNNESGSEET